MHQTDEFSSTDLRHAAAEAWRVVRCRRWHFFFPFVIVSTVALIASPWVPRQFTATTVIKRESDPVLTSMMGRSWTHPYGEIRGRMAAELADPETIARVLQELNLPRGSGRGAKSAGQGPTGAQKALAGQIAAGLLVKATEASPNRDVISIKLTLGQAGNIRQILEAVRNKYMERCRHKTGELLGSAENFFLSESERCRSELNAVKRELRDFESRYPGIDPDATDPSHTEESALTLERMNLRRQISECESRKKVVEQLLAEQAAVPAKTVAAAPTPMQVNPKYIEVSSEIRRLQQTIDDARTQKGMTDEHPAIVRMRDRLAAHEAELVQMPEMIQAPPMSSAAVAVAAQSPLATAKAEIESLESKVALSNHRIEDIAERIKGIDESRAKAAEQREPYLKLKQKGAHIASELDAWQQNVGPIRDVLRVESKNRALHFTVVRDVETDSSAIWPASWMILVSCAGLGLIAGLLTAIGRELTDRSYRTVKHLATSLGVPVIQGVGEILSSMEIRRRSLRATYYIPGAAVAATLVMIMCATLAHTRLERAAQVDNWKPTPINDHPSIMTASTAIRDIQD